MSVQWRYAALGLGFLVLAGVRAAQGAPAWALVFLAAAGVNAWLAVHEAARAESEVDPARAPAVARQWRVLGLGCALVGAVLLVLEPPLAAFAGAAALVCVHRARRAVPRAAVVRR